MAQKARKLGISQRRRPSILSPMTPRRHRWIRPAARVPLFAAIGAAATVLVGWALAVATPPERYTKAVYVLESAARQNLRKGPEHQALAYDQRAIATELRKLQDGARGGVARRSERGWPLRALRWDLASEDVELPTNFIWPGFLVDTAFWGGAAFMVWSAPGFVRRGVRRRRGRCVRCGYELKGLAVCPECGGGA
jgi:hypothetical protein